jgi:hypothetical protein
MEPSVDEIHELEVNVSKLSLDKSPKDTKRSSSSKANNASKKKKHQQKRKEKSPSHNSPQQQQQSSPVKQRDIKSPIAEAVEKAETSDIGTSSTSTQQPQQQKRPPFQWQRLLGPTPATFDDSALETETRLFLDRFFVHEPTRLLQRIMEQEFRETVYQSPCAIGHDNAKALYDFLSWERSVTMIKEEWSDAVTGGRFRGVGFKVDARKARAMSDDVIYQQNPMLQEYLPRGKEKRERKRMERYL